jgi:dTDP-glucose pyrophosphorylase
MSIAYAIQLIPDALALAFLSGTDFLTGAPAALLLGACRTLR